MGRLQGLGRRDGRGHKLSRTKDGRGHFSCTEPPPGPREHNLHRIQSGGGRWELENRPCEGDRGVQTEKGLGEEKKGVL